MSLPAVATALSGMHLNITTINSNGFINMYDASGNFISDSSKWTGLIVDQINWVSKQAEFTYTLHSPSGLGGSCTKTSTDSTTHLYAEEWSGQYNCGSEDVWEGRTDAYWAPYYITPMRIENNQFTVPFFSDVGLSIVLKESSIYLPNSMQEVKDAIAKPMLPFTVNMWWGTFIVVIFSAIVMWAIEHSHKEDVRFLPPKSKYLVPKVLQNLNSDDAGFKSKPVSVRKNERGLFTLDSLTHAFFYFFERGTLTLSGHNVFEPVTVGGRFFNIVYCSFCCVWVATYTANLASILHSEKVHFSIKNIPDLIRNNKIACSMGGTAFDTFLAEAFPDLRRKTVSGGYVGQVEALLAEKCDAIINAEPVTTYYSNNVMCTDNMHITGDGLKWGVSDMAVGVKMGDEGTKITNALNYWLLTLQSCSTTFKDSACYNGKNSEDLWTKWVATDYCEQGADPATSSMLGVDDFAAVFTAVVFVGIVAMAIEVFNHRKPLKDRLTGRKTDLLKFLKKHHMECFDEGEFMVDDFMRVFDAKKEDPEWLSSLLSHVKSFYLHTDMASWKLVHMTENRIMKNYAVLLIDEMDDEKTENYYFISEVIKECQCTLKMMIERAVTEISERTAMKALEKLIRKRHRKVMKGTGGIWRKIPVPPNQFMRTESSNVVKDFKTHKRGSLDKPMSKKFNVEVRKEQDDDERWPRWTKRHTENENDERGGKGLSQVQI